jgi:WD40-like Beta Propeller Repeat
VTVEDRLRATTEAVTEAMRPLRPLDLTQARAAGSAPARSRRARPPRHWPGWLIPLAAAAAVVAVAAVLVAVRNPPRVAPEASTGPAASRPGAPAAAAPVDPEALPEYFVAISGLETNGPLPPAGQSGPAKDPLPDSVVVGETLTGKRLATVKPPAGSTFAGVTGAADDRTFVLDSVRLVPGILFATQQRTWYVLRLQPGAPVALTSFTLPLPAGADVNGIALSPDGTKLAVLYQVASKSDNGFPYSGPFTLGIYSVATGAALRTWTGTDPGHGSYGYGSNGLPDPNATLTWTSDGQRLAFAYRGSKGPGASLYLRELRLAGPGSDLFSGSTVIAEIGVSTTTGKSKIWCDSLGITGDGRTAVCGAELPKDPPVGATLDALTEPGPWTGCAAPTDVTYPGIAEISLAGDRLARVLYQVNPPCMGGGTGSVLWSSPSGDTVLGSVLYTDDPSMTTHYAVVLYSHGRATTVNWPGVAGTLLADQTAF